MKNKKMLKIMKRGLATALAVILMTTGNMSSIKLAAAEVTADQTTIETMDQLQNDPEIETEEDPEENKGVSYHLRGAVARGFSSLASLFSGRAADTLVTKKVVSNPTAGISKITFEASGKKDGYTSTDDADEADRTIPFKVVMTPDQDYIDSVFANYQETDPLFPMFEEYASQDEWQMAVEAYFAANTDVTPIQFTYNFGTTFILPTTLPTPYTIDLNTEGDSPIKIGSVAFTKNDKGELVADIVFEREMYAMILYDAAFTINLVIDANALKTDPQVLGWNDMLICLKDVAGETTTTNPEDLKAQIEKFSSIDSLGTDFVYTLYVSAANAPVSATLAEYTVTDQIPQIDAALRTYLEAGASPYLQVDAVYVDGAAEPLAADQYTISEDGSKFTYVYAADATDTFSELTLQMSLTTQQIQTIDKYNANHATPFKGTYKNVATVTAKGNTEPDDTAEVSDEVTYQVLQKDCQTDAINGRKFNWTLTLNTYNGDVLEQAYLIDVVDASVHTLSGDVEINGQSYATTNVADQSGAENAITQFGSVSSIETTFPNLSKTGISVFDYTYSNTKQQVMIIPLKGMGLLNNALEIKYDTEMLETQIVEDTTTDAGNVANLVAKYKTGQGPGVQDEFSWNIDKSGTSTPNIGSKMGLRFDEKTQKADWRIRVNYFGSAAGNFSVTDTLTDSDQVLYPATGFTYTKYDTAQNKKITSGNITAWDGSGVAPSEPYYTTTADGGNTTYTMQLGTLAKTEWYDIRYATKVVNENVLFDSATGHSVSNTAQISVDGNTKNYTASLPTKVTWITNESVDSYNYKEQLFSWKTTINPDHLRIANMTVTDAVSDSEFNVVTKATRILSDGSTKEGVIELNSGSGTITFDGYEVNVAKQGGGSVTYTFPIEETTDTFIFEYNTKLTNINSTLSNEAAVNKQTVQNTAVVTGQHQSKDVNENAVINNTLVREPATKVGNYSREEDAGKIPWKVLVNKDRMDMTNVVVTDTIGSDSLLELDTVDFHIYKAVLNPDGTVNVEETEEQEITRTDVAGNVTATMIADNGTLEFVDGFKYTIPAALKDQPLWFVFDTYFTDSVTSENLEQAKNKIELSFGATTYTTPLTDGGFSGGFNIEDYASVSKKPVLLITKQSSNSQSQTDKDQSLVLEGAEFSLEAYTRVGNDVGNYIYGSMTKKAISKSTGNATYVNLRPDVLYKVTETKAPAGYVLENTPKYYLFLTAGETPPSTTITYSGGSDGPQSITASECAIFKADASGVYKRVGAGDGDVTSPSFVITNTPKDQQIVFSVLGADGVAVGANEVTFTLTQQGGENVKSFEAKSDASGKVTFSAIDPGLTYILKETTVANRVTDQGASFIVTTSITGEEFSYTIAVDTANSNGTATLSKVVNDYTIRNHYRVGNLTFTKTDAGNDAKLGGVTLALYKTNGTLVASAVSKTTTSNTGTVTFENVPYSADGYVLAEQSTVTGYKLPSGSVVSEMEYPIVATITATELEAAAEAADNATPGLVDGKKKPAYTIAETITNDRVTGTISLKKTKDDSAKSVEAGRSFKLYYTGADGYYGSSAVNKKVLVAEGETSAEGTLTFDKSILAFDGTASVDGAGKGTTALVWGTYVLEEVLAATDVYNAISIEITKAMIAESITGTTKTAADATFALTVTNGATDSVQNTLKKMDISLEKEVLAADGGGTYFNEDKLGAVTFTLSGKNAYGEEITAKSVTTDASGTATFTDVQVSDSDGYLLTETYDNAAVQGYKKPKQYRVKVAVTAGKIGVTEVTPVTAADTFGTAKVETADVEGTTVTTIKVTDEPCTATLSFTKHGMTDVSDLAGLNEQPLAGVSFMLCAVNDTANSQTEGQIDLKDAQIGTTVSTASGIVTFSDVVYGQKYVLFEKVPDGYSMIKATTLFDGGVWAFRQNNELTDYKSIEITQGTEVQIYQPVRVITAASTGWTQTDPQKQTIAYTDATAIENHLITQSVKLHKIDMNGLDYENITFQLYRKNSQAITENGTGLNVMADGNQYYKYLPQSEKTTDENGMLTFENLPTGDYLAVEAAPSDVQEDFKNVGVYFSIDKTGNITTVKETESLNTAATANAAGYYEVDETKLAQTTYWNPITAEADGSYAGSYTIENMRKYGFFNIYKVSSDVTATGLVQTVPLEGVTFTLYKDSVAEANKIATVTTGADGTISRDMRSDGENLVEQDTYNGKYLTYGTYYLVEESTVAKHALDTTSKPTYQFTLSDGANAAGHKGTAWIVDLNGDGTGASVTYVKAGETFEANNQHRLLNKTIRSSSAFSLQKVAHDNTAKTITNAAFDVSVKEGASEIKIAEMSYNEKSGKYELEPVRADGKLIANADGVTYLAEYAAATNTKPADWRFLAGEYVLKETSAGSVVENSETIYYKLDERKIEFAVGADGTLTGTGIDDFAVWSSDQSQNTCQVQVINKKICKMTINNVYIDDGYAKAQAAATTFKLVNTSTSQVLSFTTTDNATYIQDDISDGTYTLQMTSVTGYQFKETIAKVAVSGGVIIVSEIDTDRVSEVAGDRQVSLKVKNTPETVKVTVDKTWNETAAGHDRLTSLTYTLTCDQAETVRDMNGKIVEAKTVDASVQNPDFTWNVVFENLPRYVGGELASYSVIETTGNPAQTVSSLGYQVEVTPTGNANVFEKTIALTNTENQLTIKKLFATQNETTVVNTWTNVPKFGLFVGTDAVYEAAVTNITTNGNAAEGTVSFTQIADGDYTLREISTDDRYQLSFLTWQVHVEDGIITISQNGTPLSAALSTGNGTARANIGGVTNYTKGSFSFTKMAAVSGVADQTLEGATFSLKSTAADATALTAESDNNGKVTFSSLDAGTYILEETQTVDGYIISTEKVEVTVSTDGVITFENDNQVLSHYQEDLQALFKNEQSKITILEKDDSGNNLGGITLKLQPAQGSSLTDGGNQADGSYQWTTTDTDALEEITGKLIAGNTYTIMEVGRKDGYQSAAPVTFTYTKDGNIEQVQGAENMQAPTVSTSNTYTTDATAHSHAFVIRSKEILADLKLEHTIPAAEEDYTGISFELYQYLGSTQETDLSQYDKIAENISLDASGVWQTTAKLPEGYYYFKQTNTKDTLYFADVPSSVVYIGPSSDETRIAVQMENVSFHANVTLTKTDAGDEASTVGSSGDALAGAEFTLYLVGANESKTKIASTVTDEDGKLSFDLPQKGTYELTETKAPKGYVLETVPYAATFTVDHTSDFQNEELDLSQEAIASVIAKYQLSTVGAVYTANGISNKREAGSVTLIKKNEDGEPLNGVEFILYKKGEDGVVEKIKELITGTAYEVYDSVTWTETSGEAGSLMISGLPWGDYYIEESVQLDGYSQDPIRKEFTINGQMSTDVDLSVAIGEVVSAYTLLNIQLTDATGRILPSAQMRLSGKFVDGSSEMTWTTATTAEEFKGKLIAGEIYTLSQISAPQGYIKTTEAVQVRLTSEGDLETIVGGQIISTGNLITIKNSQTALKLENHSPTGTKISGYVFAVTGVFAPTYEQLYTGVSATEPETITVDDAHQDALTGRLIVGNVYTVQEITAPDGYVLGNSITFTVNADGTVQIMSESTEYTTDATATAITMVNDATTLRLEKTDMLGEALTGAEYTITGRFADGETSKLFRLNSETALEVQGQFIEGERYTLQETKAPNGYILLDETVVFDFQTGNAVAIVSAPEDMTELASETVTETISKTIYTLSVKNEAEDPIVTADEILAVNGDSESPSQILQALSKVTTGDQSAILIYLIIFIAAAGVGIIVVVWKKRKQK